MQKLKGITFDEVFTLLVKNNLLVESSFKDDKKQRKISYIAFNSKDVTVPENKPAGGNRVKPDETLFFCTNANFKEEYLREVVEAGVKYYVSEKKYPAYGETEYFIVNDIRLAMADIAAYFYGNPAESLRTFGITGTKGKTTSAYFLAAILNANEKKSAAYCTSIETNTGVRRTESALSTPEALDLHKYLYEAKTSGRSDFVMEVSSQAYKTARTAGIKYDYGFFLNISEDHISPIEHRNFNDYFQCKLQLLKNSRTAVISRDADFFDMILDAARNAEKVITFGSEKYAGSVDYCYFPISENKKDNIFIIKDRERNLEYKFKIKMPGYYNIENAAAVISAALDCGVSVEVIAKAISDTKIPGRMEVAERNGVTVIVDYAHNALSFRCLFNTLRKTYAGQRIISVGGAVGGKCYNRRREFASEVGANSDFVYLTADDPQNEKVEDICEEIVSYMSNKNYKIIPDRKKAVEEAILGAGQGDVIVLLSKGVEKAQKVGGASVPYEGDMNIAEAVLPKRRELVKL